tara:strand:- start:835 stop:3036 length:2202 start_codon:yes stop_codon:yes gene_type:complete
MATHDYVLDNATGANFRTDLNNALAAIVSNNSSSSEPSTKYAYQWWADTSAAVLKIRNSANDGWVELFKLDGTLTLADGTNSAPALAFRDDSNTGIFSSAADTLDITCGGTTRGSFSSSGLTVTGGINGTGGNIILGDSSGINDDRIKFGASGDLQIYHDSNDSYIHDAGTGHLNILATNFRVRNAESDEVYIVANDDGAVSLYFDNNVKAETVTGGFTVTGTCTATSFAGDGSNLTGVSGTTINNNGDNRIITGSGTAATLEGEANLTFDGTQLRNNSGAGSNIQADGSGSYLQAAGVRVSMGQNDLAHNTAVGNGALDSTTSGSDDCTAVGHNAMTGVTTGADSTGIGSHVMTGAMTGSFNTCLGHGAMNVVTSGAQNTALGRTALLLLTTGSNNVAVGMDALDSVTTSGSNMGIGSDAGQNISTGTQNVAIGTSTLQNINTGSRNIAIGHTAMQSATGATHDNCIIGLQSGYNLDTSNAYYNTALGNYILDSATSAHSNTGISYAALSNLTTGDGNVAIGIFSMVNSTTAAGNTCIGNTAGHDIIDAQEGVCLGNAAGFSAGNDYVSGTGGIYIGSASQASSSNVAQEIVLAYNQIGKGTRTFLCGADLGVYHAGNTTTWTTTSDERIKKNIVDNNVGLDIITKLQPRNFEYRSLDEIKETTLASVADKALVNKTGTQLGFVAQELEKILPAAVHTNELGIKNVNSDNIIYYLINAVKELSTKVTALEAG